MSCLRLTEAILKRLMTSELASGREELRLDLEKINCPVC